MQEKLNEFAKELDFEVAKYVTSWNNIEVYSPEMLEETDEVVYTGWPIYIFKEGENIRYGTHEECRSFEKYWDERIEEFAKGIGFDSASYDFDWKDYSVYFPENFDDEDIEELEKIYILEKRGVFRVATREESEEIYTYIQENF